MYILIHNKEYVTEFADHHLVPYVINTDHIASITDKHGFAVITMTWGKVFDTEENIKVIFKALNVTF